jgi:hypothetical protein
MGDRPDERLEAPVSARRWLLVLSGALGVAAAATIVAWTAFGAGAEVDAARAGAAPVAARGSVAPRAQLVAERVEATIEVIVDRSLVDPASVEVRPSFRPYTRVAPVSVERTDSGRTTLLRYRYELQCIDRGCIEAVAGRTFEFAPATVQVPGATGGQGTLSVAFPTMTVASRLAPGDVDEAAFRADAASPPALDYSVEPGLLGWLLAGAAAAVVLALAGAAFALARRTAPPQAAAPAASGTLPPLARALARLDAAAAAGEPERRAALDELARALEPDGRTELVAEIRRRAWSRTAPEEADVRRLAASVAPGSGEEA